MPMTVNGFGTSVCGGRGDIGWGAYDAMEWLTAFYMPLVPLKAVHTFDWNGSEYRMVPIRWSGDLVLRTFVNRWVWGVGFLGSILLLIAFLEIDKRGVNLLLFTLGPLLLLLAVGGGLFLRVSDERNKKIRRVLGGMTIGNCDPAHLTDALLDDMAGEPRLAYGTDTFADAVEPLLEQGSYARAMWAARVCKALEDDAEGEALTDRILNDPDVADALEVVRGKPAAWAEVMQSAQDRRAAADEEDDLADVEAVEEDDRPATRRRDDQRRVRPRRDDERRVRRRRDDE